MNAAQRGMKYFVGFNCVGCHAANGGGGMGPALSNGSFKFGSEPAQMYNVIAHGGPQTQWGDTISCRPTCIECLSYGQVFAP